MNNQKAFYEIEKPKKITYTVAVRPQVSKVECAEPGCNGLDEYGNNSVDEVYECGLCGQWFCIHHIDFSKQDDFCEACAKLPVGVQDDIIKFRDELNQ